MKARKTIMSHEQAVELLPWLINGSMDEDQEAKVREHARACVVCRRELEELELISSFIGEAAKSEHIPPPDMRNINARIDEHEARQGRVRRWLTRLLGVNRNPWRTAFAVQTVLAVALAVALAISLFGPAADEPEFTTLTRPPGLADGHYVRAVFNPDLAISELAGLLEESGLTIASGPTAQGIYTLAVPESLSEEDRTQLLGRLQENPDVRFAQWAVHR